LACFTSAMPHVYGTCCISKPCSGFLQQHLRSYHQWYVFLLAMPRNVLHFTHCASSHRHWVLKISTVSLSRACLKCLFNRLLYPTDPWNMVSSTRCFPFFVVQGILNRCSNTRIVCSSPHPVGPTNLYTCVTLASVTLVYVCQLASHLGVIHLLSG
jgi:hypothetical protein